MQAYSHAHHGPSSGSHYKCNDNPVCGQTTNTPVSFVSTTQVRLDVPISPTVNPVASSASMGMVLTSQNQGVSSMVNTESTSQPQDCSSNSCRKCGKKNHKCKKKPLCKNAKVRNTTPSSALRILHQT